MRAPTNQGDRDLIILMSACVGAIVWMIFMAAPGVGGPTPFLIYGGAAAFALGFVFRDASGGMLGYSMTAGPLLLAPWTTSRGDGDGLWTLIFPLLLLFAAPGATLLVFLGNEAASAVDRFILNDQSDRSGPLTARLLAMLLVPVTAFVIISWWPNPWPDFERALERIEPASPLVLTAEGRFGDPLYGGLRATGTSRSYGAEGPLDRFCEQPVARFFVSDPPPRPGPHPCSARVVLDVDGPYPVEVVAYLTDDGDASFTARYTR